MSVLLYVVPLVVLAFMLLRPRGIPESTLKELIQKGAQIVDVRTSAEFRSGHPKEARNIPLAQLEARCKELDSSRPVLLCCASGSRSGMAVLLLKRRGFTEVHNAGPWTSLRS